MQPNNQSFYCSSSSLDAHPQFTAWEHSQQPEITLKALNNHLHYLQYQYKTICKGESTEKGEQNSLFHRKRSLSKVIALEQNQIKLPQVKVLKRGRSILVFKKRGKENLLSKGSQKKIETKLNQEKADEKKILYKRRSGSQFSQLRDYFRAEVSQKDIFLHKNKVSNISKTINLQNIKNENSFSLKQQAQHRPTSFSVYRKFQRKMIVRT